MSMHRMCLSPTVLGSATRFRFRLGLHSMYQVKSISKDSHCRISGIRSFLTCAFLLLEITSHMTFFTLLLQVLSSAIGPPICLRNPPSL